MVCGGFNCSKNALAALNVLYILVSFILIGVSAYARVSAIITSLALAGSLIACGVILFLVALVGLVGAVKHHQVLLFFYMIILFLLFLLQFSLACACLAVNADQRKEFARQGWRVAASDVKAKVQAKFDCCGFSHNDDVEENHPACNNLAKCCGNHSNAECCTGQPPSNTTQLEPCPCSGCIDKLQEEIQTAFSISGGVGLFFSFTEILGVWITIRYRNQKDPRANPSSFL